MYHESEGDIAQNNSLPLKSPENSKDVVNALDHPNGKSLATSNDEAGPQSSSSSSPFRRNSKALSGLEQNSPVHSVHKDEVRIDIDQNNFENKNILHPPNHLNVNSLPPYRYTQGILTDAEFKEIVYSVKEAIDLGIQPIRIRQGTSGSYFVRNKFGKIVGVFKPKNEEPYGHLNPKWTKWLHKTICPCFFGRSCLLPNLGYISETAASVLDRKLGLNIVPRTEIVELASPSFYYSWLDKQQDILPNKIGSFQVFLTGYKDAYLLVRDMMDSQLSEAAAIQFQHSFERLIILDYLMRNTDRGMDNWMIFYGKPDDEEDPNGLVASSSITNRYAPSGHALAESWQLVTPPVIRIAAIDNGLAFPFKHPDQWRSYPFGWAWLPCARAPFSEETRHIFLQKLSDIRICEDIISNLRRIFMIDKDFDEHIFNKQMAIFRGQWHNLVESIQAGESPYELIRRPLIMIFEDDGVFPADPEDYKSLKSDHQRSALSKRWKKMLVQVKPFFSWC